MTAARKTIVITGASSGIGAAAARQLHSQGHEVVIVGRDAAKTKVIADELGVVSFLADYSRLEDVRRLASDLSARYPHIDVLVNNAGAMYDAFARTEDGFERTFQVNHLAPYLLTRMLAGLLVASKATVIWTSSIAIKQAGEFDIDRLGAADESAARGYKPLRNYGQAKLASTVAMMEFHRRFGDKGMSSVALHPGIVATAFGDKVDGVIGWYFRSGLGKVLMTTADKSAERIVRLAVGTPGTDWQPGTFDVDGRAANKTRPEITDVAVGFKVWDHTEALLSSLVA
jgi:NAD(P)-dependent dehydrogenase (short-subunit alcohol dehydrogenase family)